MKRCSGCVTLGPPRAPQVAGFTAADTEGLDALLELDAPAALDLLRAYAHQPTGGHREREAIAEAAPRRADLPPRAA